MNDKNRVFVTGLIGPSGTVLVRQNESYPHLCDDLEFDIWKGNILNGEKTTTYGNKLVYKSNDKIFTLKRDVVKKIIH